MHDDAGSTGNAAWGAAGPGRHAAAGPGPHPPAGWYPDPGGTGARWWDGYAWTSHTAHPPAGAEAPPAPVTWPGMGSGAATADLGRWRWEPASGWQWMPAWAGAADWSQRMVPVVEGERRLGAVLRWGLVTIGAFAVCLTALRLGYATQLAAYAHWFRAAWHAVGAGRPAPTPPTPPAAYVLLSYLSSLTGMAVAIVFLVWQHRAASAARWLGLPARHSPAWGVAFWFIPVANLWCPYQALRDCLPPGHPVRRRVLVCWLLFLASSVVDVTGAWAWLLSGLPTAAGDGLLTAAAALWVVVLVLGWRLVAAVGAAHEAIVGSR